MKKYFLILVTIICGLSVKAQPFTDFYSDSRITAQIRDIGYSKNNCRVNEKHLFIKNKTNGSITVNGIIKIEFCQCAGDYKRWETQINFEIYLYPNSESRVTYYYHPESKIGYNNTLGFWIDTIDGVSATSNSNQEISHNGNIPSWLIGEWYNNDGITDGKYMFTVNNKIAR